MARGKEREENGAPPTISIIGPGMHVYGDCVTDGTLRIEGTVTGTVYAGKAVVIGQDGMVVGDVRTQDGIISGRVIGTVMAASRLEVQATSRIEGDVHTRRLQLEEGAVLNGEVRMGEVQLGHPPARGDENEHPEELALQVADAELSRALSR
ncbi:MAG: polymer-forming cytoskeletal protein [Gemmatimonadetes bacterium]|nr:polymer-forming cytoskeletal protein [Gemmatimonadota bacterium]